MKPSVEIYSEKLTPQSFIDFIQNNDGIYYTDYCNELSGYFKVNNNEEKYIGVYFDNVINTIKNENIIYFEIDKDIRAYQLMFKLLHQLNLVFSIKAEMSISMIFLSRNVNIVCGKLKFQDGLINYFEVFTEKKHIIEEIIDSFNDYKISFNEEIRENYFRTDFLHDSKCNITYKSNLFFFDDMPIKSFISFINKAKMFDTCISIGGVFLLKGNDFKYLLEQKNVFIH